MDNPLIKNIRNITISGRIATGKTTLANNLAKTLNWNVLDGGQIVRKFVKEQGLHIKDTHKRPDAFDLEFEELLKNLLKKENNYVIQSHLAGFDAQGIDGIFKILLICENDRGEDKASIRIDRLMNRDEITSDEAKEEILEREQKNLEKYRRLYADNDPEWVYWDPKYYDLLVNTYSLTKQGTLDYVLEKLGFVK